MSPRIIGICEVCEKENIPVTTHYGNMKFCDDCWASEQEAIKVNSAPAAQEARVTTSRDTMVALIDRSKEIDNTIQIRTELFNAATVSIMELKKAIDEDPNITNKPYALAEALTERFNHFKQVVFQLNEQLVEAGNNQKAIHSYLNQMSNTLRAEEREKLKIQDLNYKPTQVKQPTVRKITTRKSSKTDKAEIAAIAKELGISEFMIQQIVVAKQCSPKEAREIIRESIRKAKGE